MDLNYKKQKFSYIKTIKKIVKTNNYTFFKLKLVCNFA